MIVCANKAVVVFYKTRKIFRGIFMTKRIFALVFVLLFALSFAACDSSDFEKAKTLYSKQKYEEAGAFQGYQHL